MSDNLPQLISFWSRQMSEHALFLALGFVDAELRSDARSRHVEWELFREEKLKNITRITNPEPLVEKAEQLCVSLRSFKQHVLDRLLRGEWLGWIYPSFVRHTRDELDYFVSAMKSERGGAERPREKRRTDELLVWVRFMRDHADFAAHLLDPAERAIVDRARSVSDSFSKIEANCASQSPQLVALSKRAGTILDKLLGGISYPVKSIIHPALAAHVIREGQEFQRVLDTL